jgi:c-di-GMP-binding flagellar brake protein YcgR
MSLITPFPEAESPALERFALRGRDAIVGLLDDLRERQTLVTVYFDQAAGFTVGNVLEVDAEGGGVVLDCAGDSHAQRAVVASRELVVIAFLDSTKIQFTLSGAEPALLQGRDAFRAPLPARVLRIQRRSAPRRHPPDARPARCRVPVPAEPGRYESVRVLDISLGGMAMLAPASLFDLARDQILQPCYLDLPDVGQVGVTLRVRYLEAWPSEGGGRRCGCELVGLGGGALRSVQRYIESLESARPDGSRCAA